MATAKLSRQPWPPKLGLPGLVTSKAELSRQPWSKKPGLPGLKIQARLDQAFLNFQAKNVKVFKITDIDCNFIVTSDLNQTLWAQLKCL